MNSIRKKITVCLMLTVLAALFLVGGVSISLNYTSTAATVDQMMCESAALAAERVEQELMAYKNVAADTGCIPQLSSETIRVEDKRSIIDERVTMHNFQRGNIIGEDGIKEAIMKKFGDVILSSEFRAKNIWMEYFPLLREDSFTEMELIPVWCVDFEVDGQSVEDSRYSIRFNAITGEEIS